ncbi:MAG TPA: hypothetical protein PLO57_03305 [Candidatus Cloacimonadota bacterium]|nr:hypothetical protein [Candidatus Cloacimonadota bacterium]
MKRALVFLLLVLCLCFMACAKSTTSAVTDGEMPIRMNLEPALNLGFNVSQVRVTIQKGDFNDQLDLIINGNIAAGTFTDLEPGTYAISVMVYDGLILIATGQGTGTVVPAQTTTVHITLQFVPGALEIQVTWGLPYENSRRVLLVGNSHTYYNGGVDNHLELLLAAAAPEWSTHISSVTIGGATLQEHLENANTIYTIETGDWDLVILQEQSSLPMSDPDLFYSAATALDNIIRSSGALTGLYMTWERRNYPEMYIPIRDAYNYLGAILDALVIPAGEGFHHALSLYPSLSLYDSDNSHASLQGTYLVACIMLAKIWNINPLGNPYHPEGIDAVTTYLIQELAWNTVQGFTGNWHYDDSLVPDHQNPSPQIEAWNSLGSKAFEPDQVLQDAI